MLEQARGRLSESLEQIVEVFHETPDGATRERLEVTTGTLAFDEARAPLVELRVTVRLPDDLVAAGVFDPRKGSRLIVRAGYVLNGTELVEDIADLRLDSRGDRQPDGTMELVATSHELLMQEWSPLDGSRIIPTNMGAADALEGIIRWHDSTADIVVEAGTNRLFMQAGDEPIRLDATTDTWDALVDIADRAGSLWVYADALGVWRIRSRPTAVGTSDVILNVGENGTVIDTDQMLSRQDWGNAVVVVHEWEGQKAIGWARIASGPMSPSLVGLKAITVKRTYPATPSSASRAAESLLQRAVTRGRTVSLRAIAAWWVRPGHTASVGLAQTPAEKLLVSRVEFGLTDGRMRTAFRHPETASIITGA